MRPQFKKGIQRKWREGNRLELTRVIKINFLDAESRRISQSEPRVEKPNDPNTGIYNKKTSKGLYKGRTL
jgi:hypothetical protein